MKKLLAAPLVVVMSAAASAASNVVVIDGDTIAIGHERIRILSIDTPETFHSRCENELVLGLRAKERLRELLKTGDIRIERDGQDRYHRTLANVFAGGVNVGQMLLKEGFALSYRPGAGAKLARLRAWCGPEATLDDAWSYTTPAHSNCISPPGFDLNPNHCALGEAQSYLAQPAQNTSADDSANDDNVHYPTCAAAHAVGAAPIHAGQPGYRRELDRDGDGVACE